MRTLIIDNYDSFTYNLWHDIGSVTGVAPVVVRNDDPAWRPADLDRFAAVVISPGPGRPDRPADFGICAEVIRAATVPLLGVCLGHQGLCHGYGAVVGPAPRVSHGEVHPVHHDGVDLFAGLPSPLPVVRYHSLAVTDLPAELEPLAHTEDGVLMAVRHRSRPQWGVQFHPESICTEHGAALLTNFLDLAGRNGRVGPVDEPVPAAPAPRRRLTHRRLDLAPGPDEVFETLYGSSAWSFWLDSGTRGRFSFLGDASGPLARVVTADVARRRVTVTSATGEHVEHGRFLDWLDADLLANRVAAPDLPFDFALGWVGYLGYELKAECGGDLAHRSPHPDAVMIFADRAVVLDHQEGHTYLLSLVDDDEPWLADTEARLRALPGVAPPATEIGWVDDPVVRHDRAAYTALIAACQREITAGESYEICLTNQLTVHGKLDPLPAYRRLRAANPEPFGALLRLGQRSVLSSSPERFLSVSARGVVTSSPIKGTRPRGATPDADAALAEELAASAKDRAENLMIVDLVRNDLGSQAVLGSVSVESLFAVETYATVHQLVSTVRARLRPGLSAVDCVRAAFPGGSMTGAPKRRTMRIIDELEAGPRGVYSGALGYFSCSGAADLSIVIRTIVLDQDQVTYGVGGAIIALSDPADEHAETAVKATPLLHLLDKDFPGQ